MGQLQTLEDLLSFLTRRWWVILAIIILGFALSATLAKMRPDIYEATAVIQAQGAQIGLEATNGGSAQMLQAIEQRLTTREALLAMIARQGLYADLPALSDEERAALLRASIRIEGVASAGNQAYGQPAQISAIIVTAHDQDADKAARIANDLAQSVLDMAAAGQMARAQDTLAFYREEETRLSGQVAALDGDIAAYKQTNSDALPEGADARRDEIASIEADLRDLDQKLVALTEEQRQLSSRTDLRATEQRRLQELTSQIAVLGEQRATIMARRDVLQAAGARQPEVERGLAGLERQLALAQGSLTAVQTRLDDAETALRLAERQQGDRLALLDRAVTPGQPTGSGGKKLFMAGAIGSVLLALVFALILDLAKPVIRTSAQLERQLGLRAVIALPDLGLPTAKSRRGSQRPARAHG
ncbi:Wzz/FepE/Etk N-terminal domain-containing protein [Neotabrizicola sp. sgz301269]|uniref:Wzz/FepE/Etk N-terminal domain-containing protein n=1 Tax=Neotabrizicola sp. sgz301269 TaxID=3276282 RepID=UPI00376FF28D